MYDVVRYRYRLKTVVNYDKLNSDVSSRASVRQSSQRTTLTVFFSDIYDAKFAAYMITLQTTVGSFAKHTLKAAVVLFYLVSNVLWSMDDCKGRFTQSQK